MMRSEFSHSDFELPPTWLAESIIQAGVNISRLLSKFMTNNPLIIIIVWDWIPISSHIAALLCLEQMG